MARCSSYKNVNTIVGGYEVKSVGNVIRCSCDYYLKHGRCHHAAEVISSTCNWKGEPNMTIINDRPVKVCPRCGTPV